ncbi:cyclic nucleotide-binding domain-containing protein 1-like [Mytilus galloprovincialis]|uniref:Cyclic nucleotide-binding domain-containing protein n=1 Tax=Mytilus galloprovincialis TaxID=29158 RepID=A0A8B6EWH8_MYTGA|nr:Hypothetical predicted protein [Mytilus galloprovincialis]
MALVKVEKSISKPGWVAHFGKKPKDTHKHEDIPAPTIDYEKLKMLCGIEGLKGREDEKSSEEAHETFMTNYKEIFAKPPSKRIFHAQSKKSVDKFSSQMSITHNATGKKTDDLKAVRDKKNYPIDEITHDIRDYLPLLHKERKSEHPEAVRADNLNTLRKLLRKLPFERTASDNDKMFSIFKTFRFFNDNVPDNILKELCVVALFEQWKDTDFTVFGRNGLYMVLKGSVRPLTYPHLNTPDNIVDSRSPTPLLTEESKDVLQPGDFFGTLDKVERKPGSRIFSVETVEPNCEFLKILSTDYTKVITQIDTRGNAEKKNLLLTCGRFQGWSDQTIVQVAKLIEWVSFPPNTILVSEGYKAPYIGFIKSGECHVLRQVEVMKGKAGHKEKKMKHVVMGRLTVSQSFGEISVLKDEPITCSIVTATNVSLGIIKPERIQELDDVTIQLFTQSNEPTFNSFSKDEIQDEYMNQELKQQWNEFKHSVVVDVINSKGIRPGYGKWAKY